MNFFSERYRNGATQTTPNINQTDGSASPSPTCSPSFDILFSDGEQKKIAVVWHLPDGSIEKLRVDLENDVEIIRQWKNAGRKARIILEGFDLDLPVKYPEAFNLLVDTNR